LTQNSLHSYLVDRWLSFDDFDYYLVLARWKLAIVASRASGTPVTTRCCRASARPSAT